MSNYPGKVTWADGTTGYVSHVDYGAGIVILSNEEPHDITGMSPVKPADWPFVHRILNTWIGTENA